MTKITTLENVRISQLHDIEANWNNLVDFIPENGEIIIYDKDENNSQPRIKIGDGINIIQNLPFITNDVNWEEI